MGRLVPDGAEAVSHGRRDAFEPAWEGAAATGAPFPDTSPLITPDFGDTMAEARTRYSCQMENCAALTPSVDLMFDDVWSDPAVRMPDPSIALRYADLVTPPPTAPGCVSAWSAGCRIVINYETHIHPLWNAPRDLLEMDEVTVAEPRTCAQAGCHAPVDALNAAAVPAAQLDLTDGPSPEQAARFNAYRELLFTDNAQEVVNGALQDIVIETGVDEEGNPILVNVPSPAPMSANGARSSPRFFAPFAAGGIHEGFLSDAELRLLSEWLDIGAQYYNNPFDAPVD